MITGGVSNLSPERLDYLQQVMTPVCRSTSSSASTGIPTAWAPMCRIPGSPVAMPSGRDCRASRPGARACTEVGHHTAKRNPQFFLGFIPRHKRLSDETVAKHVTYDLTYFRDKGCLLSTIYQLNDGPTDTAIDRYGIRRTDGTAKPAATAIAAFVAANP